MLQARALKKSYYHLGREVQVLRGVELDVEQGEKLAIVGKSGVGKSTLLHVLGTLDKPTSGSVRYWGEDVFSLPDSRIATFRNRKLGFIFQFHHLLPEFTALENVMIPSLIANRNVKEAHGRAESLLDKVGLSHRMTHRPGELSGGEQQRVAIARALVMEPNVVFADEPTGNLDERTSDGVHDLLFRLNEEMGLTLVVVTHSLSLAQRMDRQYVIRDGALGVDDEIAL